MRETKITFLRVLDNAAKLQRLCEAVHYHFLKKEKVLIGVSSDEAAAYIDQLLWRMPEDSFIPHAIINGQTKELVAITKELNNVNRAQALINLRIEIPNSIAEYTVVYDLLDLTQSSKEEQSRKRQEAYRLAGYSFEEI
jgi:DNA polymerase III subunit chi